MKKEQLTTTLRPEYKENLSTKAKEKGLSVGQYIEFMLDEMDKNESD